MGRTGKYTEEFKRQVAKDRVENSLSVRETAKKYGISNGTVCIWTDMFTTRQSIAPTWLSDVPER